MKTKFKHIFNIATSLAVAIFITCWLNVFPTFWKPEVMDLPLLWGITVRSIITFLVLMIPAILLHKQIAKIKKLVWMAALLPFILWGVQGIFYANGGPDLAKTYPIYGVIMTYTVAMMVEAIILEVLYHSFSCKDLIEDFLFTVALSLLFYGIITVLGFNPFEANTLGMAPVLALVQLWLAKTYHTPKA